ncbi:MAG: HAD family hydrolase [Lachnospiraceae bacterium]|nr:HAD family hydrolase [Lachnospiraceae bacterium]
MIKMIATDLDGTLVKESSPEITQEQAELFRALADRGVVVTVASGRQYGSVRKVFAPVDRPLCYIAENGAHILKGGQTIHQVAIPRNYVEAIMEDLRRYYPMDAHVCASTTKGCFVESKNEDFIRLLREGYRNDVTVVDDILAEPLEIVKIAVYKKGSIREVGEREMIPKWKDLVKATMGGEDWVDFMDASVDKGNGLMFLTKHLGISPEEVVAFGDNGNDIGLMQAAGESFAVGNAVESVKRAAKYVCPPYWENGVAGVLRRLLENDLKI